MPLRLPGATQPNPRREPKPPAQSVQSALDILLSTIGAVGGTYLGGPVAGGVASGAGYALADPLGRAMGLPGNLPPSLTRRDPNIPRGQALADLMKYSTMVGGQMAGGMVGANFPKAPVVVGNWAKSKFFTPDAAIRSVVDKARAAGFDLNLAQATGKPWLQRLELSLRRRLPSTGPLAAHSEEQVAHFEQFLQSKLDDLFGQKVSPEEFVRQASDSIDKMQTLFNKGVEKQIERVATRFSPSPVSPVQAGEAIDEGLLSNWERMDDWANRTYTPIMEKIGGEVIDASPLYEPFKRIAREFPDESSLQQLLPADARALLRAFTEPKDAKQMASVVDTTGAAGVIDSANPTLTLEQLRNLRSSLLYASRKAPDFTNPVSAKVLHEASQTVNDLMSKAITEALPGTPLALEGQSLLKANETFRKLAENLRPPARKSLRSEGNVMAAKINAAEFPEDVVGRVVQPGSQTRIRATATAVSPQTVYGITGELPPAPILDPMNPLRRSTVDALRESATVPQEPFAALPAQVRPDRISPQKLGKGLEKMTPPTTEALMGSAAAGELGTTATPSMQAREDLLFSNPFVKKVQGGVPEQAIHAGFPAQVPAQVPRTLELMPGRENLARRAYAQNLIDRSQSDFMSTRPSTNPAMLEQQAFGPKGAGETLPAALGPAGVAHLRDATEIGRHLFRPQLEMGRFSPAALDPASGMPNPLAVASQPSSWLSQLGAPLATAGLWAAGAKRRFLSPNWIDWALSWRQTLPPAVGSTSAAVGSAIGAAGGQKVGQGVGEALSGLPGPTEPLRKPPEPTPNLSSAPLPSGEQLDENGLPLGDEQLTVPIGGHRNKRPQQK